jgi:hypothetical protein
MSGRIDLTDEQKKFIEDNYKKMSAKHMAKKLHVPRHAAQRYCEELASGGTSPVEVETAARPVKFFAKRNAKLLTWAAFIVILLFALFLRRHTFNLPHFRGDQHHYIALAFKLDTKGMDGYNLRGVDIYRDKRYPQLAITAPAEDKGHLLKSLEQGNITYYDQPLHHIPFGFPIAIMISHTLLAPGQPYYMLQIPNDYQVIRQAPPGVGLRNWRFDPAIAGKQVYSIIVPLLFSMLMIALIFFTARTLYKNDLVALVAMFLIAISPIDILTSQKLWSDDMTAALGLLAVFLYVLSLEKKKPLLAFLGGLSCGISAVTKQSGAFIVFVLILWHFAANSDKLFKKETFLKTIFDKNLILFGAGALLSAGYWFFKVYSVYGNPVYRPHQAGIAAEAKTAWFKMVGGRPKFLYLVGTPYQNPLFALAYISPLWLWLDRKNLKKTLLPIIWIAVFLYIFQVYLGGGKEHRYMLPAYPAYAILGAYVADRLRTLIDRTMGPGTGSVLLFIVLIASAIWSIPMAMDVIFTNGALIMKPF